MVPSSADSSPPFIGILTDTFSGIAPQLTMLLRGLGGPV